MVTEFEKRAEERRLIKKETRRPIRIGFYLLGVVIMLAVLVNVIPIKPLMTDDELTTITNILSLVAVMMMIIILAVRKTIYYSPRFVPEDFTLLQVLKKWQTIDIVLMGISLCIVILGVVITVMGMPFSRTFHFFVASGLLMPILMPIGIKMKGKLDILRQTHPNV